MDPVKMRIDRIMDFGPIVSIVGTELASNQRVVIHVDYRPIEAICDTWRSAGLRDEAAFEADQLMLNLEIDHEQGPLGGGSNLPPAA
jgi:hypothetical protein